MKEILLTLLLTITVGGGVFSQTDRKMNFGLSIDQSFAMLTNADKTVQDHFIDAFGYDREDFNKRPVWNRNTYEFDVYTLRDQLIFSFGMDFFHFKYDQDSAIPTYGGATNYGLKKRWLAEGLLTFGIGYKHQLHKRIYLHHKISFSPFTVMKRYKEFGIPYNEWGQSGWDENNLTYRRRTYRWDFQRESKTISLNSSVSFELGIFSLRAGLTYFYFKNFRTSHNGLYLNTGVSLRFKK